MTAVKSNLSLVVELWRTFWKRHRREPLSLALTLLTAPGFVLVYSGVYGDADEPSLQDFVPSLVIFAVIMLIFSTAMSIAREAERGTLDRLRMTPMGPAHYLSAVAGFHIFLGIISVGLTFVVAMVVGFDSEGSVAVAYTIAIVCAVACIGIGILVGSLAESVYQAFLMASLCMFLLLLFSGALFPLPDSEWFTIFDRSVGWIDLLPTVHAVEAMGYVLLFGDALLDVRGSVIMMLLLSLLYFCAGWSVFVHSRRNHL